METTRKSILKAYLHYDICSTVQYLSILRNIMSGNGFNQLAPLFSTLSESELDKTVLTLDQRFHEATTTNELHSLIAEIDTTTASIDKELNHFSIIKLKKHQQETSNIELNRAKLSTTILNSTEMTLLFSAANDLGHSLTFKIKSLDQEIGNVKQTLNFVSDIQALKNNINQASYAIEHKNWELAAQCLHTITSKLPPELVNGNFASVVIPSTDIPELPSVTVQKWIELLTEEFQKGFNEASKNRNVSELTKYFQLFPLIQKEEIGLNCYSKFICQIITDTLRSLINSASGGSNAATKHGMYLTISMKLFENISMMLSQHGPLIKKYYGSTYDNAISYVVTKIQHEIDSQIGLISDTFYDIKRIDKVIQDISLYNFPVLSKRFSDHEDPSGVDQANVNPEEDELVSIVEIGDLVSELAGILHNWALYCKFITLKYYQSNDGTDNDEGLKLPKLITDSNFTDKIHKKFLPAFESLYSYYFRRSLEKAITIEELPSLEPHLIMTSSSEPPDQVPCSSVIEDATLVLNTTLRNIIDTAQPITLKRFINEDFKVIQRDLINGFFIKNLNYNQPRYNSTLTLVAPTSNLNGVLSGTASPGISRSGTPVHEGSGTMGFFKGASSALGNVVGSGGSPGAGISTTAAHTNNAKLMNFVLYLNTVAMGQEYFTKIFESITKNNPDYLRNNFPFGKDLEKIASILKTEFLDPFISITNKIIQDSLINFYNQSLKNKLLNLINDCFPDANDSHYIIYSVNSLNDNSTILRFTTTWQSLIRPYKQTFHKSLIFHKLLRLLVVNLANLIEKKLVNVLKKFKINELGSLKLEKDMSHIINEMCEDNYELREKFVRVTQLVLLVGMDDEEYDMSNEGGHNNDEGDQADDDLGVNWVLTPMERKQARKFRV